VASDAGTGRHDASVNPRPETGGDDIGSIMPRLRRTTTYPGGSDVRPPLCAKTPRLIKTINGAGHIFLSKVSLG